MAEIFEILLGIAAGVALLFGAIYLAIRPYVSGKPVRPKMADPSGDWDKGPPVSGDNS